MGTDTKIIHVQVIDGEPTQLKVLSEHLTKLKNKLPFDVEFLITNNSIELRDIKFLIDELIKLYKMNKGEKK